MIIWRPLFQYVATIVLAQPGGPIPAKPPQEIVDCHTLKGLSLPIKNDLGIAVRCRLDTTNLVCLPGLTIEEDVQKIRDLCVTPDRRPVTDPYCVASTAGLYPQKVIQRGQFRVDLDNGTTEGRWLDIPYGVWGRKEILAQRKPIIREGRDICVYLREESIYLGRPRQNQPPHLQGKPTEPK